MSDRIREITLYETESGRCPVADFIESIKFRIDRAKIMMVFEGIETIQLISPSVFKKLKGSSGLWEIKIREARFLGFYVTPRKLVLLHGFNKKSTKTPIHAIAVARERMRGYCGERELL